MVSDLDVGSSEVDIVSPLCLEAAISLWLCVCELLHVLLDIELTRPQQS